MCPDKRIIITIESAAITTSREVQGIQFKCQRFVIYDEAYQVVDVSNLGYKDVIAS